MQGAMVVVGGNLWGGGGIDIPPDAIMLLVKLYTGTCISVIAES